MSAIFYLGSTNSDLTGGREFSKYLEENTETAGTIDLTIPSGTAYGDPSYAFTRESIPLNDNWETGSITVKVNITDAGNARGFMKVSASRINSTGTVQETSAESGEQALDITGVLTFSIPSMTWTSGNVGDRLRINYYFRSNHHNQPASGTIETGTTNTAVETPIVIDPFDAPSVITQAADNIQETSARLNMNVESLGAVDTADVFFEYRVRDSSDVWSATTKTQVTAVGSHNDTASGLLEHVEYEFKAVIEYERSGTQREEGSLLYFTTNKGAKSDSDMCTISSIETHISTLIAANDTIITMLDTSYVTSGISSATDTIVLTVIDEGVQDTADLLVGYSIERSVGTEFAPGEEWDVIAEVPAKMDYPRVPTLSGETIDEHILLTTD